MWRYFVGGLAALLMAGAGVFLFQSRATPEPVPPAPKAAQSGTAGDAAAAPPAEVPRAPDRSREEKRFDRNDKDKNGIVSLAELQQPRRKAFAKLDTNGDGKLSFEEWTVRTSTKFAEADKDKSGGLNRTEFATTAPKRRVAARPQCDCRTEVAKALAEAAEE